MTPFKKHLSLGIEARPFDDSFGGYSAAIHRLAKKIASHQISNFLEKREIFRHPIFLSSS
jgi:hypothetical protein